MLSLPLFASLRGEWRGLFSIESAAKQGFIYRLFSTGNRFQILVKVAWAKSIGNQCNKARFWLRHRAG
jgi:hypothetical protein